MDGAQNEFFLFDGAHTGLLLGQGLVVDGGFYTFENRVWIFALLEIEGEIVVIFEGCFLKGRLLCLSFNKSFSKFAGFNLLWDY